MILTSADVILGLLHQGSFSGYELKNYFVSLFSHFYDASFGTIYPTLKKLESTGMITKHSIEQENRPNKNVYSLTDKGREQFRRFLYSPVEEDTYRSDFMVRLYFGQYVGPETAFGWVERELAKERDELDRLLEDHKRWGQRMSPTQQICISVGIEHHRAKIHALQEGIGKLENLNR